MVLLFLRTLWTFPGTFAGLCAAPFFGRRSVREGVMVCEGAGWPRKLGWRYRAITLGEVVLCVDDIDDRILAHELVHVRQWRRWGPLFLLAYPLASGVALLKGGHPYRDNAFEAAAYRQAPK